MHSLLSLLRAIAFPTVVLFCVNPSLAQPVGTATPTGNASSASSSRPGFFGALGVMHKRHASWFCHSPLGRLLKNSLKPLNVVTGGMIPAPAAPAGEKLAAQPSGPPPPVAVDAALKIKQAEKEAESRREAVRYLATVDCHWYPEAELGLLAALRGDGAECVRLEAALALGQGRCCTKKTLEALRVAASGSNRDGNPSERSPRVRMAAFESLQHCLQFCTPQLLDERPLPRPEQPASHEADERGNASLAYYDRLEVKPANVILFDAERTLAKLNASRSEAPAPAVPRNLVSLWASSQPQPDRSVAQPEPAVEPASIVGHRAGPEVLRDGKSQAVVPAGFTMPIIRPLPQVEQQRDR